MSLSAPRWRVAVLVAMGAWVVHQLRYALVFSSDASAHVDAHAHQYLDLASPLLAWAVAAALATWVISLARPDSRTGMTGSRAVWLRASTALILIYCAQETVEGLLAPRHPNVLLGVFGSGGWIALPLSVAVSAVLVLLLRGARMTREIVARTRRVVVALARLLPRVAMPRSVARRRLSHVLATKLAGRAPPRTV